MQPWATLWRPCQTMVAGDIVYVIGGTFSQLDPGMPGWGTLLFLDTSLGASGTVSAPISYLGYPGNPPLLQNAAARRGIYLLRLPGIHSVGYFQRSVNFHPHIHSIVSRGGWW